MGQRDFYAILDECVSRLRQGEPPEACLDLYPAHAAELAPDLVLTAELLQLSRLEPSPAAVANGYQKMMAAFDSLEIKSRPAGLSAFIGNLVAPIRRPPPRRPPLWRQRHGLKATALRVAMIAVVIVILAASLVVTAAADTLPGDALYPVKRSWESARLALTVDESSRQALQSEYEQRRRLEVEAVLDLRRPVIVEFKGEIESLATEVWQVAGLELTITDDTQVTGVAAVGRNINVRAQVKDDGSLNALVIIVEDTRPSPRATPTTSTRPSRTARPTSGDTATRDVETTPNLAAPTPTPTIEATRPEATVTVKPTSRPTLEPTSTPTPSRDSATSVDGTPSIDGALTRDPQPTSTPPTDCLATSASCPTRTPVNTGQTATKPPVDAVQPTPTATSLSTRDLKPTPTPTATRNTNTWDQNDRPP